MMGSLIRVNSSDSLSLNETRRSSIIKVKMSKEIRNKTDKKKKKNKTGILDNTRGSIQLNDSDTEVDLEQTIMSSKGESNKEVRSIRKKEQLAEDENTKSLRNKGYQSTDDDDAGVDQTQPHDLKSSKRRDEPISGNTINGRSSMSKRRQPITAWSVDIESSEPETRTEKNHRSVQNIDSPNKSSLHDCEVGTEMKEMLETLSGKIEHTEESIADWKQKRKNTKRLNEETYRTLEQRRLEIEELLRKIVDEMVEERQRKSSETVQQLDTCIKTGENNLRGMRKIYEKYSSLPDNNCNSEKLKAMMVKVQDRCGKLVSPSDSENMELLPSESHEQQTTAIRLLLGCSDADRCSANERRRKSLADVPSKIEPRSFVLPDGFLETPQLVLSVICRWKKDKKSCGITDLALTDDGRMFVVDNNNKSVKFFDSVQSGGQLVRVLGREVLQKPSRVSYLSSLDRIIVTDDGTKSLRVFSASDGSDLGNLCPPVELENYLQHPVGHCEMPDGRFAVLDFKTKSIILWNLSERNGCTKILTDMQCPAYLSVTSSGRLAVTDWKTCKLNIFDIDTGTPCQQSNIVTPVTLSRENLKPLSEPHGVCCDVNGLVFVADRRQHNVRVYGDTALSTCPSLATYDEVSHKVGVPFAVACNSQGLLAVADYVGTIRMYKYMEKV